ncbi:MULTISPECIES: TetR/AcrR family transcriptional regulator [Bacillus]|uniref:TetR/AcrR family transcriptional regulator n=1 Tax=Bacillus TaxID=1386 RepID=UPI00057C150A|nr:MULTISPECIES: TetR/AcrR family transcriptional regulator [Bacillus]
MNKNDRRYLKTEREIYKVFGQLLNQKNFDQITITDITTLADINRGTFYLHYKDKHDLLSKCQQKFLSDLKSLSSTVEKLDIVEYYRSNKHIPFLVEMIKYYKENHLILGALLKEKFDLTFKREIQNLMEENIFSIPNVKKQEQGTISRNFLISYVFSAHFGIIREWLNQGMQESPEEIASLISRLSLQGFIKGSGIFNL